MTTIEIRRITTGPSLLIDDAERLVLDFIQTDPSSAPNGYDDKAGRGDPGRITKEDIVAINTTMRARSPHAVWEVLTVTRGGQSWLAALDTEWDLVDLEE